MAKNLEITLDKARAAWTNADNPGKKLLTDLLGNSIAGDITDRINTWENVLEYHDMTQSQFDAKHSGLAPDTYAYEMKKLLVLALNEGYSVPLNETGYYPYFNKPSSGRGLSLDVVCYVDACTSVGPRLWYKNEKLARHAGTKFTWLYEKFFNA